MTRLVISLLLVASFFTAPSLRAQEPKLSAGGILVPDITGTWRVAIWYQEKGKYEPVEAGVMEIRRVGAESFLIDQPWVEKAMRILVKWSDANRRFQGVWDNGEDEGHSKITLQPASDNTITLRVVVTKTPTPKEPLKKGGNEQGSEEKSSSQQWPQEWTRVSLTLSTTQENHINLTGAAPDTVSHGTIPTRVVTPTAIPDTPAAKRLVEQLGTQESAAAAEAATIRQLQANGQAEQNQQPIAEHQRKLKNLLSTAFDLKLQWEELQVQELQSRLSRLERQIGQRKELREKIINRRAGELIEGDALKWNSTPPAVAKLADEAARATSKIDPILSPDTLREQLEPFAKRVTAAEGRVRELEAVYFRDRTNAAELQLAFEEMTASRFECRSQLRKYIPAASKRLDPEFEAAKALVEGLKLQLREKIKSLSEKIGRAHV